MAHAGNGQNANCMTAGSCVKSTLREVVEDAKTSGVLTQNAGDLILRLRRAKCQTQGPRGISQNRTENDWDWVLLCV